MTIALLLPFDSPHGSTWIDPLAVASLERCASNLDGGTRLVTRSGECFELTDEPDAVARLVNDARREIAEARRREALR